VRTLIYSEEISSASPYGTQIAPGEGRRPIPFYLDKAAEELSFPTIYCGYERQTKDNLSYTDIAKSELRRYDRRACIPTKVLYAFKKSFNEKVRSAVQVCFRKKTNDQIIKASEARTADFINNAIVRDEGYSLFKNIQSSPSYWKRKTQTIQSMVRQIGKYTLFITLSAAETQWTELLVMLKQFQHEDSITEMEASNLSYTEKADLIRKDPVTCMRHFDHRFKTFFKTVLESKQGIFSKNKLTDYFTRLEFQARGSPHSHGLYWLENSPEYIPGDEESVQKCCQFIDEYITCERNESPEIDPFVS